ncbi:right-handed parallel beta-helix repeat-containing protein [Roseomonas fluvialis]|uniref:Right handed beta helix domain-containing protein n=1 Tax=Roseomonas fluvialis TaxID=1750527 RepID=A0ABM7Y6C0_9PROT|nr:right-handed parallel beta-helix repeat-containing protein [Roseomonas fluvialis]BDG73470.1 hypothetical protein Rmf_33990 [Roseomonas fluvialis]
MALKRGTSVQDSLIGTDAADSLYGGDGADTLSGMAGADRLDGGAGADRMLGGFGADTYLVNDPGDLVVESDDGSVDLVSASVSYVLPAFVDNLTLTGTANLTGTGNSLNNVITGNAGANLLTGGAGNDRLNGGAGADTMRGGAGNDTYVVADATDVVTELQGEGVDLILSSVSLTLAANVEKLTLSGTSDLVGGGNTLNNALTGNAGGNVLVGGAGNDIIRGEGGNDILRGDAGADQLYGGAGTDVFVLSALQDSRPGTQRDIIQDFNAGEDLLHLIDIAPGLQITYLGTSSFVSGSGAVQTRMKLEGADGVLQIDAPGTTGVTDGVVDAEILLKGVQSLQLWNIMDAIDAPAVVAPPPSPVTPPTIDVPTTARTVYIDTSASRSGDGSLGSPFNTWGGWTLQADTSYLFKAGTVFNGVVVVQGQGTEAAPIVVGSYGSGAPPVIQGSISVENAAYVTIADLTIRNSEYAGVAVQGGSRDITILNNTIQNTGTGVWFGSDTGGGNLLQGNLIEGNRVNGVAFNRLDHSADPTRVVDNVIRDNGSHGIEIHANGISVENNTVSGNGRTIPGSTGIHIYGGVAEIYGGEGADGFGFGNVVRGNRVFDNREASSAAFDGNGIQADTYTGNNRIEQNIVYGNDGAGIIAYDSSSNVITGNTISGNGLNRAGNPNRPLGEIILNTDIGKQPLNDLTRGNVVQNNSVTTNDPDVAAFYMDGPTADNGNVFGGNTVERLAGGNVYVVGSQYGTVGSNLSLWNTSLAPGGGDDVWVA